METAGIRACGGFYRPYIAHSIIVRGVPTVVVVITVIILRITLLSEDVILR